MICPCCGTKFDEPFRKKVTENLDGEHGWDTWIEEVCPWCGEEVNFEHDD